MAGIGKNRGGVPSQTPDKGGVVDAADASDAAAGTDADPADAARFRDAMKSDAAMPDRQDRRAGDSRAAERAEEAQRMAAARRDAATREQVDDRHEATTARRHDDEDDKRNEARDEAEVRHAHEHEPTADDAQMPQENATDKSSANNLQPQGNQAQPTPQTTTAMMQAAATAAQHALATGEGNVGGAVAQSTVESLSERRAGRGASHERDELDDDTDRVGAAGAGAASGTARAFEAGAAVDEVDAPDMHATELAELADKLVDRIRVSIPDSPGAAVTLTLSADVLQGAEITLHRDADGLRVAIQTPSIEVADRVGNARDQFSRRLGDRLNERVQVSVVGPSSAQTAIGASGTRGRGRPGFEDDDDR